MLAPGPGPRDPGAALREILLAAMAVAVGGLALTIAIGVGLLPDPREPAHRALAFLYSPLTLLASAALYARVARRLDDAPLPPLTPAGGPAGPLAVAREGLLHALLALLGSYALGILMALLGAPVAEQAPILEIVAGGLSPELLLLFSTALVLAPLAEEVLLRHLLFRRIYGVATPTAAYVATAVAFALLHGNLHGLVVYLWLGLCFARAYARTGRLGAAILAHVGNNAVTLAVLLARPG